MERLDLPERPELTEELALQIKEIQRILYGNENYPDKIVKPKDFKQMASYKSYRD
jgi:hypothetical protein